MKYLSLDVLLSCLLISAVAIDHSIGPGYPEDGRTISCRPGTALSHVDWHDGGKGKLVLLINCTNVTDACEEVSATAKAIASGIGLIALSDMQVERSMHRTRFVLSWHTTTA